jgi:dienelactone hydrolase
LLPDATGPSDAKRGILIVYDIFGYYPQTLQGADILSAGDHEKPYQVFIPDFFNGNHCPLEWYPPDNDDKQKKIGEWFGAQAQPPDHLPKIPKIVNSLKESRGIETWAIVGFCWGGKITNIVSQGESLFKAAASCHPAMVDPSDAEKLTIPFMMLPSKDEEKELCEKHAAAQKTPGFTEFFPDQIHGWMAAR